MYFSELLRIKHELSARSRNELSTNLAELGVNRHEFCTNFTRILHESGANFARILSEFCTNRLRIARYVERIGQISKNFGRILGTRTNRRELARTLHELWTNFARILQNYPRITHELISTNFARITHELARILYELARILYELGTN